MFPHAGVVRPFLSRPKVSPAHFFRQGLFSPVFVLPGCSPEGVFVNCFWSPEGVSANVLLAVVFARARFVRQVVRRPRVFFVARVCVARVFASSISASPESFLFCSHGFVAAGVCSTEGFSAKVLFA